MKRIFLAACLVLGLFVAVADAQFYTSETARKAGEKMSRGDRAGALEILDRAIEKREDLLEAYQMRASLRSTGGDVDGAVADFSAALEINPSDPRVYERRAMFRAFRRDHAGALKDFDAAIANGLKTEKVYTGRAAIKRDMGDAEGAIADYQTALGVNPDYASAVNGLSFALERKGDADGALALLQEFLDRHEGKAGGKSPRVGGEVRTGEGVSVKRDGQEKDGSQVFLSGSGVVMTFKAGTPEEMERQHAKIEQLINLSLAYANLGRLYSRKDDFDRALESYEKGLKIRRGDPYIHKLRSQIRIRQGDLRGAIEDLTVVADSPQGAPDRHFDKGLLLVLQGKDAEAEKEFALHLRVFPGGRESLNPRIEEARKLRAQPPQ
jgi:tetratricopeptide (TPR) repeat protein